MAFKSQTYFLVHGWRNDVNNWPRSGALRLLKESKAQNVFVVDWKCNQFTEILEYKLNVKISVPIVGEKIGKFVHKMHELEIRFRLFIFLIGITSFM